MTDIAMTLHNILTLAVDPKSIKRLEVLRQLEADAVKAEADVAARRADLDRRRAGRSSLKINQTYRAPRFHLSE